MSPIDTAMDKADCTFNYTKLFGDIDVLHFTSGKQLLNFLHCIFGKFSIAMSVPLGLATAITTVSHILGMSTKVQMGWIYTSAIIALVTHAKTRRDGSIVQFPRNDMRAALLKPKVKLSVSVNCGTLPLPTSSRISCVYLIKQCITNCFEFSVSHCTPTLTALNNLSCLQYSTETKIEQVSIG